MMSDPNDNLYAQSFNWDALLGVMDVGTLDASTGADPEASHPNFESDSAAVGFGPIWALSEGIAPAPARHRPSDSATSFDAVSAPSLTPNSKKSPSTVTVADGGQKHIAGPGTKSVFFDGSTGKLVIDKSVKFTGDVSGLSGSDILDLADIAFDTATQATFLGTSTGGTLTVSNGKKTATIELTGDYLSSTWSLSSNGKGGTNVVDPVVSSDWQVMKVGAGGYADGLDEAPDGTLVVRTDTNGAYLWNGSSWTQLVTASSMPAAFLAANPVSSGEGVYELQVAASDSNVMYMMFDGDVFVSANQGTTWTQTSFANVTESPNDSFRFYGQKMAIDPNNSNIVYVGTPQNGLWVTTNGGTTWSKVGAVPVSGTSNGAYPGITGIMFDPGIGGVVAGATQTIFASSYGNGVYESLNGGSTWTHLSGGPLNVEFATVGSNGAYYAVGNGGQSLWRYYKGAWTDLLPSFGGSQTIQAVAVNKTNPSEIVAVASSGYLNVSYDGGTTWSGIDWSAQVISTDIPWEAAANTELNDSIFLTVGGAAFSTTNPNELILSTGTGSFDVTIPTTGLTGNITYQDMSLGIENLVANEILVAPGGKPILASWDRPFIRIDDLGSYPTTYGPIASTSIVAGWSVDYASSTPSFLVGLADWWGVEESGFSTDDGQTWTPFATDIPGASTSFIGGTIAASTTLNFIWAPADGNDPYYTLDGGKSWKPVTLPGVTSWSGFDYAYYLTGRTVTADRVLTNTFYLYDNGVFETTNGGVSWTEVYTGVIAPFALNSEIMAVPGESGNLFWTGGIQNNGTNPPSYAGFYFSSNQGKSWTAVANVLDVIAFGFGAAAKGQTFPSVYIVGYVNDVYGIWQSTNKGVSWTQIGTQPAGELDQITTISGDPNKFGEVYVGFSGGGYAYLNANDPTVTGVSASPANGVENPGDTVTFTVSMSTAVTVSGGVPTLNLNDGGVATYVSGSGSDALVFSYTVTVGDSDVTKLAISSVALNGATVEDSSANPADLSGADVTFPNLGIDPPSDFLALTETPATGDLQIGQTVTFTLKLSKNVTIAKGIPTLTLNDGGVATYVSGSGTEKLIFTYTVAAGQSTDSLLATALALHGATMIDSSGSEVATSLLGLTQAGPQVDTLTPAVDTITESPADGYVGVGAVVTFTVTLSDVVTVAGGTPTLTLNDGGVATYTSGSGSSTLTFSYMVGASQSTNSLAATALALNGATIANGAGTAADLSIVGVSQAGPSVGLLAPTVMTIAESPASGNVGIGYKVKFVVHLSSSVVVSGGVPTLTLNSGGVATYVSGSGTTALTFSYSVAKGQSATSLAATSFNLNGATIESLAGTTADLSISSITQTGAKVWNGIWLKGGAFDCINETIYLANKVSETLIASNDVVNATSTGDSLTISGNGISGLKNVFNGNGASILLKTNSYLQVLGADEAISVASDSTIEMNGDDNWIGAGSGDNIWLDGGTGATVSASDDTFVIAANVGALILGSTDIITAASGDTLTIGRGAGDTITASGASLIFSSGVSATLTGSDDTISAGSSADTLTIGGNGATGLVDAVTSAWYDTLTIAAQSNVSVSGGYNTVGVGANSVLTMTGSFDKITVASGDTLSLGSERSSTIEVGSLGGGTVTFKGYNASSADVIDLLGGVGGYTSAAGAAAALTSDGAGGSLLSLGVGGGTLYFSGVKPSSLSAADFRIG